MKLRIYNLNYKILFLIASLSFLNFCSITIFSTNDLSNATNMSGDLSKTLQGSEVLPNGAIYNWSEKTYRTSYFTEYINKSEVYNITGTYSGSYVVNKTYDFWNASLGKYVLIKETNIFTVKQNYTSYYNCTFSGNFTVNTELSAYYVNITNGNNLQLMWIAVKNGTIYIESYISKFNETYSLTGDLYQRKHTTQDICDITNGDLLWKRTLPDEITDEPINKIGEWNDEGDMCDTIIRANISGPIILTLQIYKTNNNEMVAWTNLMDNNFIIFNDTNYNGIIDGYEGQGVMTPWALSSTRDWEYINKTTGEHHDQGNIIYKCPKDKEIRDIAKNIIFSPPKKDSNNKLSWNISYNEFPVLADVDNPKDFMNPLYDNFLNPAKRQNNYNNLSPGNFSFGYNFNLSSDRTDLDTSMELSKISNSSFYDAVQGLSLSVPYHSFFVSTSAVNQSIFSALTRPEDLFSFNIKNTQIAQLNAGNPLKKNYKLYNYTGKEEYLEFESIGEIINSVEVDRANPLFQSFIDEEDIPKLLLLSVENITKQYESLENSVSFYTYQRINYPTWSGEKLIHDPTLTTFYGYNPKLNFPFLITGDDDDDGGGKPKPVIPFGDFYLLFMTLGIVIIVIYKNRKYLTQKS